MKSRLSSLGRLAYSSQSTQVNPRGRLPIVSLSLILGAGLVGYSYFDQKFQTKPILNEAYKTPTIETKLGAEKQEVEKEKEKEKETLLELISKVVPNVEDYEDFDNFFANQVLKKLVDKNHITGSVYYHHDVLDLATSKTYFSSKHNELIEIHKVYNSASSQHNSTIHIGILTHLLDEAYFKCIVGCNGFRIVPYYTVNLTTSFNFEGMEIPKTDSYVVLRIQLVQEKSKEYKKVLKAEILDLNNKLVATSTCIYVKPRSSWSKWYKQIFG